tara:strand:- start:432 stop:731 length:300 start_codon:yes stop_codon:yes gene_type:complete
VPSNNIDIDEFFDPWDALTVIAFQGQPSFIRDSFEEGALSMHITHQQFKNSAKKNKRRPPFDYGAWFHQYYAHHCKARVLCFNTVRNFSLFSLLYRIRS